MLKAGMFFFLFLTGSDSFHLCRQDLAWQLTLMATLADVHREVRQESARQLALEHALTKLNQELPGTVRGQGEAVGRGNFGNDILVSTQRCDVAPPNCC